jgi:predicted amidohydrolase
MFDAIVAAAISFVPTKWDLAGNTQRLVKLIRQATAATPRPDVILAPEGVLQGYLQLQQVVLL